ncbi:uncharacterized protein G2W53_029524 [Senna tora]|uniref:Uncharacterized protein n=1 Tax=Senna tora TaxID=362788 RepID=A0A834W9Q7_9FABA|nr:uncharacterized protein G2W53_029524 [Senna tora]
MEKKSKKSEHTSQVIQNSAFPKKAVAS